MKRTHEVSVYRPTTTKGERSQRQTTFSEVESEVGATIQARSGGLRQREYGQEVEATYEAFLAPGTDVEEGDVLKVTDTRPGGGSVPDRLEVTFAHDPGGGFAVEAELGIATADV